jgi:hypothetical protein
MPVARFEMPDGRVARFEVPEGATPEQAQQMIQAQIAPQQPAPVADKPKLSKTGMADKILNAAYRLTPLGMLQTANDVGTKVTDIERNYVGDKTLEATGSPAAATTAYMAPDILNLGAAGKFASLPFKAAAGNALGKAAERIGYKPSIPQVTQSRDLSNMYDTLSNMPFSAGVIARHEGRNSTAVNKAVASSVGQQSDLVTADVLANASDDLGKVRDQLRNQVNIPRGEKTILDAIDDASTQLKKSLNTTGRFKSDAERIKQGLQSGNITGEQYQIWRTDLRDAMDTAYKAGKSELGRAYKKILSALDDSARQGAGEAWKANDKQFATLEMIQKGNIVNPVTGDVSAPLLTNQMYRDLGKSAKQGRVPGPIADIATITKGYPTFREGSQTARREAYNSIFPWLMSPFNYTAAKVLTSNPYGLLRNVPYGVPAAGAIRGVAGLLQETEE